MQARVGGMSPAAREERLLVLYVMATRRGAVEDEDDARAINGASLP